jgi:short-subunit dehydrogenase
MARNGPANRPLGLVTGASSGIGLALANELVDQGYDVAVVAEDAAVERPNLLQDGTAALAIRADLTDPMEVEKVASRVGTFGRALDVLAINAGVGAGDRFIDRNISEHLRVVDLNVRSAVQLVGLLVPPMVEHGSGRVLLTSSIAATLPGPYQSAYNTSKAFLLSFAEALRTELRDTGVTVTALMPGPTDTAFFERAVVCLQRRGPHGPAALQTH